MAYFNKLTYPLFFNSLNERYSGLLGIKSRQRQNSRILAFTNSAYANKAA
jgi:hypothetical protein